MLLKRSFTPTVLIGQLSFHSIRLNLAKIIDKVPLKQQDRVVRRPVNVNPGLNVNRSNNFSCIKMFFNSQALASLRLFKFKTEGQTI